VPTSKFQVAQLSFAAQSFNDFFVHIKKTVTHHQPNRASHSLEKHFLLTLGNDIRNKLAAA